MPMTNISDNWSANVTNQTVVRISGFTSYIDPLWSKVLKVVAYVIVIVTSLVGNSIVVHVISKTRSMKTTTNYLISNMAVADLLITCVSMPVTMSVHAVGYQHFPNFPMALTVCKLNPFLHGVSMEASILSLSFVAFDRLFAITSPMKKIITFARVKIILVVIWIVSMVTLSPLLYVAKVSGIRGAYYCDEQWPNALDADRASKAYTVILFVCFYAIPLALMAVLYAVIIVKLWGRKSIGNILPASAERKRQLNRKVLKMLITVVVIFALCWLPLHVRMFLAFFGTNKVSRGLAPHLFFLAFYLAHLNSSLTPLIYNVFNEVFRREFKTCFSYISQVISCSYVWPNEKPGNESSARHQVPLVKFSIKRPRTENVGTTLNTLKLKNATENAHQKEEQEL